jgi:hypothetical protein
MNCHIRYLAALVPVMMGILAYQDVWAGMENCRFAMHWKPKFSATQTITSLCDDSATTTIEPNRFTSTHIHQMSSSVRRTIIVPAAVPSSPSPTALE